MSKFASKSKLAITLAIGATMSACALTPTPDAKKTQSLAMSHTEIPSTWTSSHAQGQVVDGWLTSFNDPELINLVQEALAHNADLKIATTNVERAIAYTQSSSSGLYPSISAAAFKKENDAYLIKAADISVSWEIDLWGRVRYGDRAAKSKLAAAEADFTFAKRSLAALVAKGWFHAIETNQQLALAEETATLNAKLLSIAQDLQRVGKGNQADVSLAEAGLSKAQDNIRNLKLARAQAVQALEVLAGRYPSATLTVPNHLTNLPRQTATGVPSTLLERRPDVIAAEREVAAAFDLVGQAKAARLPSISLTSTLRSFSTDVPVLNNRSNPAWTNGGSIGGYLFDGGALEANVKSRTAQQNQAIAQYAKIALRAFAEVEDALTFSNALNDREAIIQKAIFDHQKVLEIVTSQFKVGIKDMRPVLQQELALYSAQSSLIQVQTSQLIQRVNLHLALGGDFESVQNLAN